MHIFWEIPLSSYETTLKQITKSASPTTTTKHKQQKQTPHTNQNNNNKNPQVTHKQQNWSGHYCEAYGLRF